MNKYTKKFPKINKLTLNAEDFFANVKPLLLTHNLNIDEVFIEKIYYVVYIIKIKKI
jgi:hypothetical protein